MSAKKAATTHDREKRSIARLAKGLGKDTPISAITPAVMAQYRDDRLEEISAYSVRQELALLSDLFNIEKMEQELPVENPVKAIKRPPAPKGRKRFLSIKEGHRLIEECAKSRNQKLHPFILTLLQTGMRTDEAAKLRWKQVDLDNRSLSLQDTKTEPDELIFLSPEKMRLDRYKLRPGTGLPGLLRPSQEKGRLQRCADP